MLIRDTGNVHHDRSGLDGLDVARQIRAVASDRASVPSLHLRRNGPAYSENGAVSTETRCKGSKAQPIARASFRHRRLPTERGSRSLQ